MVSKALVLEVNLNGSNLVVGMPDEYKDNIKDLFSDVGADHFSEPGNYEDGSLQKSVKNYLSNGRNFVILDDKARLESQPPNGGGTKSLIFGYHPSKMAHRQVYLSLKGTDDVHSYKDAKKIGFTDVKHIMADRNIFDFYPSSYTPVDQIGNFKQKVAERKVVDAAPLVKRDQQWVNLPEKQKFRPNIANTEMLGNMSPPECDWIFLKNYPIEHFRLNFVIPEYQRRINQPKVSEVAIAVKEDKFQDNLLRAMTIKEGKMLLKKGQHLADDITLYDFGVQGNEPLDSLWELTDGQHKTHAFLYLSEFEKLGKYNFMIQNFHKNYLGREVFSGLNSGKPASPDERINAMRDDDIPFFRDTKGYLSPYPGEKNITFGKMARAQKYAMTGNKSISFKELERFIPTISKEDTDKMLPFLIATGNIWGVKTTKVPMYKDQIFKNAYKVFYERDMSVDDLKSVLGLVASNKKFQKVKSLDNETYEEIYNDMSKMADDFLEKKNRK